MTGRKRYPAVFICMQSDTPGPRDECPNPLHDWPLPSGYTDAHDLAERRLRKRWKNVQCKDCGLYGWVPPLAGAGELGQYRPAIPVELCGVKGCVFLKEHSTGHSWEILRTEVRER